MAETDVTVVGAGVIGLTTALLLSRKSGFNVTVIAKFMPGDHDIEYTSPWAGADYMPMGDEGSEQARFEVETWPVLRDLATDHPEAGIHLLPTYYSKRSTNADGRGSEDLMKPPWWHDIVPDFRIVPPTETPIRVKDCVVTFAFTSVCINTELYLRYLLASCAANGAVIKRSIIAHISEAADLHHSGRKASVVVNCTGISSRFLGGVMDKSVVPARGQTVLVRNEPGYMASASSTEDGEGEKTYMMTRALGGGTILGGCYQIGNWESQPDLNLANRIMDRAVKLAPSLTKGGGVEELSVIRHGVGLRPLRPQGARVERETIEGLEVVHCYGHGGWGYQGSWGSCGMAVGLVEEAMNGSRAKG